MKIYRPLWAEGTFLSPQQFQQQARWEAFTDNCIAHLSLIHPWGTLAARFDEQALRLNKLKAQRLRVRMADGALIDTDRSDPLPPARDLDHAVDDDARQIDVMLALPLLHGNGGNCHQGQADAPRLVRYRQEWVEVQDLLGDAAEPMAVERYALTLRFAGDNNDEYLTCPVARLVRDGQGAWSLDEHFIPPLLSFAASETLCRGLSLLTIQLQAKRQRLMGLRRESNQRMADFAVADVSLFWLLNALNTYEPILKNVVANPALHPELVYRELAKLAGALLTFSLQHDVDAIPHYDHTRPDKVFPPLYGLIGVLLEASLPSRVLALEMEKTGNNLWKAPLNDARLREEADFYLSARSGMPAHQLQRQLPELCKIGAPDEVNDLINVALSGVPLIVLSHVPAAIPLRLENQYFALDLTHPSAKLMLASGCCVIYVPGVLADIQLELFAVLRS